MKNIHRFLLGSVVLFGLQLGMSSCARHGSVSGSVYYGSHRDPWFHDDPWMDGHHWYREEPTASAGIYIYPPRNRH